MTQLVQQQHTIGGTSMVVGLPQTPAVPAPLATNRLSIRSRLARLVGVAAIAGTLAGCYYPGYGYDGYGDYYGAAYAPAYPAYYGYPYAVGIFGLGWGWGPGWYGPWGWRGGWGWGYRGWGYGYHGYAYGFRGPAGGVHVGYGYGFARRGR
jgi:hypothetical protein